MATLERVAEDGAYAAPTLDAGIRRGRLSPRDAALATEIVYGALRVLPRLDETLARHLSRGGRRLDGALRGALRAGAYQLLYLDRAPSHAVVSDAVAWVSGRRGARLAGVANAVLRKVAGERPDAPAPPRAILVPEHLQPLFTLGEGPEADRRRSAFLGRRRMPPPLGLRVAERAGDPDAVATRLRDESPGADVVRGGLAPRALLVRGGGDPRSSGPCREGLVAIQEEGAQAVTALVGARAGERILDACAGRGGKTAALAEAVGEAGAVVAADVHEGKLARIPDELRRLRLDAVPVETRALDLTVGVGGLPAGGFDRVLVDAPCTGLGTVHRRPEILGRLTPDAPARLAAVQREILGRAASLVRPGGLLVYAVCSPTYEEGTGVVEAFEGSAAGGGFTRLAGSGEDALGSFPGMPTPDADGIHRLGPWSVPEDTGPDAYQVARWRRNLD